MLSTDGENLRDINSIGILKMVLVIVQKRTGLAHKNGTIGKRSSKLYLWESGQL